MKTDIRQFIQTHELISQGDIVCAGVSGGPDSVCMLFLLKEISSVLSFELRAFHVNHQLRGIHSDQDESFVRSLCNELGIRLYVFRHDAAAFSKENRIGTEEAGRILRQRDAEACLRDGCTKIALAHHKNDRAETMLFNLARGCSLAGISGIRGRSGNVIHPMLCFSREQIMDWLTKNGRTWRTDSTNSDTCYTRNYIRHEIIPRLETINPSAVSHMNDTAEDLIQAARFIDESVSAASLKYVHLQKDSAEIKSEIVSLNPFLVREVIRRSMAALAGRLKNIDRKHIDSVYGLFFAKTGTCSDLPYGLQARTAYEGIILFKIISQEPACLETPLIIGGQTSIGKLTLTAEFVNSAEKYIKEKNQYTKCFDYDMINDNCLIRTRRPGDYLVVNQYGGRKKLKDYFIDRRIDREKREKILLFASGSLVHWVLGYRMGEDAKVKANTKKILKISLDGDYLHECVNRFR